MRHRTFIPAILVSALCMGCAAAQNLSASNAEQSNLEQSNYEEAMKATDFDGIDFFSQRDVPPLHKLCNSSHIDIQALRDLVAGGADVNQVYQVRMPGGDRLGLTPIGIACYRKDIDVEAIRVLVELGAALDIPSIYLTPHGNRELTPLIAACDRSEIDDEAVRVLLELGADINATAENGDTAIMVASDRREFDAAVIEMLMDKGANLNMAAYNGTTFLSAIMRDERLTYKAIAMGARTDFVDNMNTDALGFASAWGTPNLVKDFIGRGFDVNGKNTLGESNLLVAAYHNRLDVVQVLHEAGADLTAKSDAGESALMNACSNKKALSVVQKPQLDLVKYLVKHGANVNEEDNTQWTALDYAAYNKVDASDVIAFLIQSGAKVNHQTRKGSTPLMLARHPNNARMLINKGANLKLKDKDGNGVLIRVLQNMAFGVVPVIVEAGADVNQPNREKYEKCIKVEVVSDRTTAGLCATNEDGFSPIHYAWNPQTIAYLARHGAKMNPQNNIVGPISLFWNESYNDNYFWDSDSMAKDLHPEQKGDILLAYLMAGARPDLLSPTPEEITKAIENGDISFKSDSDQKDFLNLYKNDLFISAPLDTQKEIMEAALSNRFYKGIVLNKKSKINQLLEMGVPLPDNAISLFFDYCKYCDYSPLKPIIQHGGKRILDRTDMFEIDNVSTHTGVPVLMAILSKCPDYLQDALHAGANPNIPYTGYYFLEVPIDQKCHGRSIACAPFYKLRIGGITTPMLAVGKPEQLQMLIDAGADVHAKTDEGYTALMFAVLFRNVESVRMLIKAGADVNARTKELQSVLDLAIITDIKEIIDILKQNGAKSSGNGYTPTIVS